jgi:prepilin-type processing-associated H-X9-DG protein
MVKARESALRVQSASNLKQIGQGLLLYANDNKGKMPDTLGALISSEDLTLQVFVNQRGNTVVPVEAKKDALAMSVWATAKGDYEFLAGGVQMGALDPNVIMVFERNLPAAQAGDGRNALFADGHVEFLRPAEFEKRLAESKAAIDKARPGK